MASSCAGRQPWHGYALFLLPRIVAGIEAPNPSLRGC